MTRCIATIAILAALLLSGLLPSAVGAETTLLLPATMAAVGDSITQAASTGGTLGADAPQNSWSTGTSVTVNSHYLRLLALGAPIGGQNLNRSVSGAKAAGLNAQMLTVVGLRPEDAQRQLEAAGFKVGRKQTAEGRRGPPGTVLEQIPSAGTRAVRRSRIDLIISEVN